jgi:hypothetical protein
MLQPWWFKTHPRHHRRCSHQKRPRSGEFRVIRQNALYLKHLQNIRSAWRNYEYQVNNMARQQRLGTFDPAIYVIVEREHPAVADRIDQFMSGITPPPEQFPHVHDLHWAASAEFHEAIDAAVWWLFSGDQLSS